MEKRILTDTDIDLLMDDWFTRDGETFSKIVKKDRLGWERTLEEGEAYSAFLLEAPTKEDLIKRAYPMAKDMLVVMDPPFKVNVKIHNKTSSYTTGKDVYVSTSMFEDKYLSVGEKLDTFLGVTIHEGCHLLYTDMKWLGRISLQVVRQLWNVIEDERIELLCGKLKPGLANFLEKSKYYYFDHYYLDYVVPELEKRELSTFEKLFNTFMGIIRYPKYLKEEDIIFFGHHLFEVKEVLTPYPNTTEEAVRAAYKIYDIFKEFIKEEKREEEEEKRSSEGEGDPTEGVGGSPMPTESELEKMAEREMAEEVRKLSEALKDVATAPKKSLDVTKDIAGDVRKSGGLLAEVCEGTVEVGGGEDTYFSKASDYQTRYMESLSRVKRFVPAISKILKGHCKEYKLIHRSMRSGVLDTNKLAEAVQGVPTVYVREGEVTTDKISVCVLIDESGSMCGDRIRAARDTAVLINEAIGKIPNIELFIYGHTGDIRTHSSTEMTIYRESGFNPKFSLGSVEAHSQNRDGIAIEETAKRVRKQTKNPVLMFILSDGAPAAGGYGGDSAMKHVRDCVTRTEKMGFNVVQVCINHSYDPSKMFKHFVILEDMSKLAFDLGRVLKKAAMNASKVRVSI